jgi:hypothetical protein
LGFLFRLLASILVAIALGFGLSWYALTDGRLIAAARVGPWAAWPDIGQTNPNPYSRAYLARNGVLQLGYAEGIQFIAVTDSAGQTLERACTYRIEGRVPGATLWTLVATDPEGVNVATSPNSPGLHSERMARSGNGSVHIAVGPDLAPGNWLEIAGEGPFQLAMTFYDATIFAGGSSSVEEMPEITRERCR